VAAGGRGPHAEERAVSEATPGRRRDEHLYDVDPIIIRWTSPMRPDRAAVRHPLAHVGAAPTGRVLQAATYRATRWTRTRARHRLTARHRHASRAVPAAFQPLSSRVGAGVASRVVDRLVPMPPQARGALLGTHPLQRRRRPAREEEREAGLGSDGRRG